MLITINILSAMSIVMALFIPYFILLHINNKLKKEVEGALNRILELKESAETTRERLVLHSKIRDKNSELQDKNWEDYHKTIKLLKEGLIMSDNNFKKIDKVFVHTLDKIDDLYSKLTQKQTLKEILEMPIEVKKPACETKLKLKEEVNANDIKTVTEIVNKVEFSHGKSNFKIGDVFRKTEDTVFISRDGKYIKILNLNSGFGKNIFNKFLQLNEN